MRFNVHAGHNPSGKIACGAIGFLNESIENRKVKDEVIAQLQALGNTVYDCTENNGSGQSDVLKKIVAKCNSHEVNLDISIHFNSGAKDKVGNKKTTGVEVFVFSASSEAKAYAERVCAEISALGFKSRGVKYSTSLYVLKNTKAPAMLIECCFVDDKDDVELYDYRKMASAIVKGITGQVYQQPEETEPAQPDEETPVGDKGTLYRVQVGAYNIKKNAEAMKEKLKVAGFDAFIAS